MAWRDRACSWNMVLQGWTESRRMGRALLRGQRQPGLFTVAVWRVCTSLYCRSNSVIFLRGWWLWNLKAG